MKPLKLVIKADAIEHYIYRGYLYVVMMDGCIVRVSLNSVFEILKSRYAEYSGLIDLAYRRNAFWNSDAAKCFLSIGDVKKALMQAWRKAADNIRFEIALADLEPVIVVKDLKSDILDMDIYADTLLLACTDGYYSVRLEDPRGFAWKKQIRPDKKFDGKTYRIASAYGNGMLSLGHDGLAVADILNQRNVSDNPVRKEASFTSQWTGAGGIINYSSSNDFQFIGNRMQRSKSAPERYEIEQFDTTFRSIDTLLTKDSEITASKLQLCFNGRDRQFFLTRNGALYYSDVKVKSAQISRFKIEQISSPRSNLKRFGTAISGTIIADQPIIEFDDKLVLVQNNEFYTVEEDSIVSMHTYPRSTHFKDVLSVTTEESINIHAIDVFDYDPAALFVEPRRYKA